METQLPDAYINISPTVLSHIYNLDVTVIVLQSCDVALSVLALQKHAHAIYRDCFHKQKLKKKNDFFLNISTKTYIVGTR